MRKYDESLMEVWDWKEKLFNDLGRLATDAYVDRIASEAEKVLEERYIKLSVRRLDEVHKRVA
ncbi:MAG: hypothetical protein C0392_14895 [Syntrophus sp. (in: bacteria)]|nr:hypothetical protein [Syntrophus sp. (in: bacteria)]